MFFIFVSVLILLPQLTKFFPLVIFPDLFYFPFIKYINIC